MDQQHERLQQQMSDMEGKHRITTLEIKAMVEESRELLGEKVQEIRILKEEIRKLCDRPRELSAEQLMVLNRGVEERVRQETKQAHAQFLLDLKNSMLAEVERLKERTRVISLRYEEQANDMQTKWKDREKEFKSIWDKREAEFAALLASIRESSTVTISRKVTRVQEGSELHELAGTNQQRIANVSELPEMMAQLDGQLGAWKSTPSNQITFER
jgi:hypothetical protein